jgi:hypothetical protein
MEDERGLEGAEAFTELKTLSTNFEVLTTQPAPRDRESHEESWEAISLA